MKNILTVDVEDWHDRISFRNVYKRSDNEKHSNVKEGLTNIINALNKYNQKATFFFLGRTALKNPDLVKLVHKNGFEIASHGFSHRTLDELTPFEFEKELEITRRVIESIVDCKIYGFRAPRFSLDQDTKWAIDILLDLGYKYDSSIYPAWAGNYGSGDANLSPHIISNNHSESNRKNAFIMEFPIAVIDIFKFRLPLKTRFMGSMITSKVIRNYNEHGRIANIYIHPWEVAHGFDVEYESISNKLRNFGIPSTKQLEYLLENHDFTTINEVYSDMCSD